MNSFNVTIESKENGVTVKKHIGRIENRVFCKQVKKSRHLFRKLHAWGLDSYTFNTMIKNQADLVRIHEIEENATYEISTAKFDEKAKEYNWYKNSNSNHRTQRFLPLIFWNKYKDNSLVAIGLTIKIKKSTNQTKMF